MNWTPRLRALRPASRGATLVLLATMSASMLLSVRLGVARAVETVAPLAPLAASTTTEDKPQSKLWTYAGSWWLVAPTTTAATPAGTWIWRLGTDKAWLAVLRISTRTDTHADVKAIGNVAHILLYGPVPELYSAQYNAASGSYEPWSTRPTATAITLTDSETASIDVDSTGRMWLATESGTNLNVFHSASPYTTFAGPITLANNIASDDIGVVSALPNNTIGVLWSNQSTQRFGFKTHVDGANVATWTADEVPASQSALNVGLGMADDHLNLAVASDGTLYAAVKTSYDTAGYPKIALLVRRPTGTWDNLYEVDTAGTRPLVVLNELTGSLRVVYTSSEGFNPIIYKESALAPISFGPRQTLLGAAFNDASSTKQNWTDSLAIVASNASNSIGGAIFETPPPAAAPVSYPAVIRNSVWYLRDSNTSAPGTITSFAYGNPTDTPIFGDWNNDGVATPGVVRVTGGSLTWYLRNTNSAGAPDTIFAWGAATDKPLVGDWDGNGTDTPGLLRASNHWILSNSGDGTSGIVDFFWGSGAANEKPIVGDWDGNGSDTPGLVRAGNWWILKTSNDASSTVTDFFWGTTSETAWVVGDWNGDGSDNPGILRGNWWLLRDSNTGGGATDRDFFFGLNSDTFRVWAQ